MPDDSRAVAVAESRPVRADIEKMAPEFAMALPAHIPVERFKRVALTAINQNPDLLTADRRTLLGACTRAAQDGLLPDGREGALVIFNTKVKRKTQGGATIEEWIKAVQWMPMVYGILKKARQSGEISSITARCVYQNDEFTYVMGDEERLEHRPNLDDPGELRLVYAIAKLKDGEVVREVMTRKQIERVRQASKQKDKDGKPTGLWREWYDEMARKSVIRRLIKYLPQSSELDRTFRREDEIEAALPEPEPRMAIEADAFECAADGTTARLAAPAIDAEERAPQEAQETYDPETGEVVDATADPPREPEPEPAPEPAPPRDAAFWNAASLEMKPRARGNTGQFYWGEWEQALRARIAEAASRADLARLQADNRPWLDRHKLQRPEDAAQIAQAFATAAADLSETAEAAAR